MRRNVWSTWKREIVVRAGDLRVCLTHHIALVRLHPLAPQDPIVVGLQNEDPLWLGWEGKLIERKHGSANATPALRVVGPIPGCRKPNDETCTSEP